MQSVSQAEYHQKLTDQQSCRTAAATENDRLGSLGSGRDLMNSVAFVVKI